MTGLELDHVLIAVPDLTAAARDIEERYGLVSVDGGRHPGWGTANRIVPLGGCYLELIAVVDEAEAAQRPFGSWICAASATYAQPVGWAVRTVKLDEVASRLGLAVTAGSRVTRDGFVLRWRSAGIEQAAEEPCLPFFIEWEDGTPFPGQTPAAHRVAGVHVAQLHLRGDGNRLAAWLGQHDLPITVVPGAPALTRVTLAGSDGEMVLDADL